MDATKRLGMGRVFFWKLPESPGTMPRSLFRAVAALVVFGEVYAYALLRIYDVPDVALPAPKILSCALELCGYSFLCVWDQGSLETCFASAMTKAVPLESL